MKVAYVAGPYSDARGHWYVWQNIQQASEIAVALWQMGYSVICPHRNTAFFDGAALREVWLEGDLEIMKRCDLVVMTPDWRRSPGANTEHDLAKASGIQVYYWPDDVRRLCLDA